MKGNNYLLDFLRGSAQFRIITESLEVINTGARAHSICQLPRSAQYHRGRPAFFSPSGQTGGWRRVGWGVGVTFAAVVLSEVVGGVCGVFVFFEDVGRCWGTMCLTCLAGDVMERALLSTLPSTLPTEPNLAGGSCALVPSIFHQLLITPLNEPPHRIVLPTIHRQLAGVRAPCLSPHSLCER